MVPGAVYASSYFYKNRNTFSNETGAAAEAPPITRIHVCCVANITREWSEDHARMKRISRANEANITREWSEYHAWMKRVNSKCSSIQLCANNAIYLLHSRLVWTHRNAPNAQFAPPHSRVIAPQDCLSRLCIDLTCNASFVSGVNAP